MGTDEEDRDMVPLNVTVPKPLLDDVDELVAASAFNTRSAFVPAVHRATAPIFSPGPKWVLTEGFADLAAGRTIPIPEARERLGIGDDYAE